MLRENHSKATAIGKAIETSSCMSGQQSCYTQVSRTRAAENKCTGDHGKQTRVDKQQFCAKWIRHALIQVRKRKGCRQSQMKLQDNLIMDDVIIVDTVNTESSSCKSGQHSATRFT